MAWQPEIAAALLVFGCAPAASHPGVAPTQGNQQIGVFEAEGRYRYVDGDRLFWSCERRECTDVLIRDERLQRDVVDLQGKIFRLRVERIDACGPLSSEVACVRSLDGTALRIVEWLGVRD